MSQEFYRLFNYVITSLKSSIIESMDDLSPAIYHLEKYKDVNKDAKELY